MDPGEEVIRELLRRITDLESIVGITNESENDLNTRIQNIVTRFYEIVNVPDIKDYVSTYEKVEPFLEHNFSNKIQREKTNFNDKKNELINAEKTVNEYVKQYNQLQELKTAMEQSHFEDLDKMNEELLAAEIEYNATLQEASILHETVIGKVKAYSDMLNLLNGKLLAYMDVLERKKL